MNHCSKPPGKRKPGEPHTALDDDTQPEKKERIMRQIMMRLNTNTHISPPDSYVRS